MSRAPVRILAAAFSVTATFGSISSALAAPRMLPFLIEPSRTELASPQHPIEHPGEPTTMSMGASAARPGVTYVDADHVADLVTTMRDSVCAKVGKGSIRMWLKLNATATIVGIGGSSEGGVEVNILCGP